MVKLAPRYGDAAKMAVLELVDYTEAPASAPKKAKQDRSKRVKGSKKEAATVEPEKSEAAASTEDEAAVAEGEK